MKKIVIINGHPNPDSLCNSIAESYYNGVDQSKVEIKQINLADLQFNPNLQFGYQKRIALEPDLLATYDTMVWADHIVWVHPVWWNGIPALMKGFIDRLFLPGFMYETIPNSARIKPLLKGKTAHIISTLDQPGWYYRLFFKAPSEHMLKANLKICGIKTTKVTYFGIVKTSTIEQRQRWLTKVRKLALSYSTES